MLLLPIDIDEAKNARFQQIPECLEVLNVYPPFYRKVGYNKPWIGYFISEDGEEVIGVGGYKGKPINNKIEIAYGVFPKYQGKGVATGICRELVQLALKADATVRITARTLKDGYASQSVLKKNGFECLGIVFDDEDGEVLEWEYKKPTQ